MLKKILIGLAVLVALFVVVVALQPSEFQVERTATIAAPPADVFAQVNDLHKWDAWSPWAKLDPEREDQPSKGLTPGRAQRCPGPATTRSAKAR